MRNLLRELLEGDKPGFGILVKSADPTVIELIGGAGYDFVLFDLEHTPMGIETVLGLVRVAMAQQLGVLVRTPGIQLEYIFRLLDMGAEGILVPGVRSQEDVEQVLTAARFPPMGDRGVAPSTRAAEFGGHGKSTIKELTDELNREQVVGVLIENKEALGAIDAIVAMKGLDFAFIGPIDLSSSLGLLGTKGGNPVVRNAIDRIINACERGGMPFGTIANDAAAALSTVELRERNARLIVVGIDTSLLRVRLSDLMASIKAGEV